MNLKRRFRINMYRGDEIIIMLSGEYYSRHEMESVAKRYIIAGHADSMGAVEEVIS